jgi:hypothetical protein
VVSHLLDLGHLIVVGQDEGIALNREASNLFRIGRIDLRRVRHAAPPTAGNPGPVHAPCYREPEVIV